MRYTNLYSRQLPDRQSSKTALVPIRQPINKQLHEINILQYLRQTYQLTIDERLNFRFTNNFRPKEDSNSKKATSLQAIHLSILKFHQLII